MSAQLPEFKNSVLTNINKPPPDGLKNDPILPGVLKYYDESNLKKNTSNEDRKAYNKTHDVCGPRHYVKKSTWRMDPKHTHPCNTCPKSSTVTKIKDYIKNYIDNDTSDNKIEREIDALLRAEHHHTPSYKQLANMCSSDITKWFPAQYNAKPYKEPIVGIDWTNLKGAAGDNLLKQWITDRMSDEKIDCFILGSSAESSCDIQGHSGLDPRRDKYKDFKCLNGKPCQSTDDFKQLISKGRGGEVTCSTVLDGGRSAVRDTWNLKNKGHPDETFNCTTGTKTMGELGYIIPEQYQEWSAAYLAKDQAKDSFNTMSQKLLPINAGFEGCINDLLIDYGDGKGHDVKMINSIHKLTKLTELDREQVAFIGKKLRMLLVDKTNEDVLSCIKKHTTVDRTICNAGLTEQMMFILNILFSIIGFNFDMNDIYGDTDNKKMMMIIDKLGDIIPKSLDKIIDISAKLETDTCGGVVSDSTKNLKKLHEKLFKDSKNIVNFDLGISKMISDATNQEFNRTTALVILGIAFLKYF